MRMWLPLVPIGIRKALRTLREKRDYKGMVRLVKKAMNVEIDLRVLWVRDGTASDQSRSQAPAWVRMPLEMPTYGSAAFKELRLDICLRRSFLDQSTYDQIAIVIAHELSHIVLASIKHPLRECEKAVDLTAMLLGFRRLYVSGCNRTLGNNELHLGYLDVREVMSAHNILAKLQKENLASRIISIFFYSGRHSKGTFSSCTSCGACGYLSASPSIRFFSLTFCGQADGPCILRLYRFAIMPA